MLCWLAADEFEPDGAIVGTSATLVRSGVGVAGAIVAFGATVAVREGVAAGVAEPTTVGVRVAVACKVAVAEAGGLVAVRVGVRVAVAWVCDAVEAIPS